MLTASLFIPWLLHSQGLYFNSSSDWLDWFFKFWLRTHKKSYADRLLFLLCLYFVYFAKLHCQLIGSCFIFNSLFPRKMIVSQRRNHGCISFSSHIEPSRACMAHNWYQGLYTRYSEPEYVRTLVISLHFRIFSPSAPGPRATAVWKGCCRVKDGEQKYVLCLRHPWHSRTWPWTLPLRSGGSWILPKGTWCWTTIGTWSRFVRMASHCDCSLLRDIILYWKWNSLHSLCFSVQEP